MSETEEAKRLRIHALWQAKIDADPWNGWRALLNNWEIEGTKVPVSPEHPFQGYYRSRNIDKTFSPVAYWYDNGKLVCLRNGREVDDHDKVLRDWPYTSRHPISHAWYKLVAEERKPWPDADARVTSDALEKSAEAAPKMEPAKIGDNKPPEPTPVIEIQNQIDNARGGIDDYKIIGDAETLAKAKSLKNRLTELRGSADKRRKAEKDEYLRGGQKIDEKWRPVIASADDGANVLQAAMDVYATEQLKAQRAEEARVAAEQAEADRIRAENERAAASAETLGDIAGTQQPVPEVKASAVPQQVDTTVRPAYGRAGRIKTERYVKAITNADELFIFLAKPKLHPELRDKLIELAGRALDAGLEPPGVEIDERAKVKG